MSNFFESKESYRVDHIVWITTSFNCWSRVLRFVSNSLQTTPMFCDLLALEALVGGRSMSSVCYRTCVCAEAVLEQILEDVNLGFLIDFRFTDLSFESGVAELALVQVQTYFFERI